MPSVVHDPGELGVTGRLRPGVDPGCEHGVSVGVEGQRYAPTPDQLPKEHEVVVGGLLPEDQRTGHTARGIVDRQEQDELRPSILRWAACRYSGTTNSPNQRT